MLSHLLPSKWLHFFFAAVLAGDLLVGKALVDSARKLYGVAAAERLTHWQNLITYSQKLSEPQKLVEVNDFFNRMRFMNDT